MLSRRQFIAGSLLTMTPLTSFSANPIETPLKLLLDTDIGSDIDDAVALAYLLREPRCKLLGITTVTGQAARRADLAEALCQAADQDVPVYAGAETPLVIASKQPIAPQADKLRRHSERPRGLAVDFLRSTIRKHPGEITLLAVGPLTNIALLFKSDPEIPQLLKSFVWMGGKYSDYPTPWGPTEWNAIVDPHAAHIVFESRVPAFTSYGLDITWQISMTPDEVAQSFSSDPLLRIVRDWSEVWFRERELLHFHDPLAAVEIFQPGICSFKQGSISVDLSNPETLGVTRFQPDQTSLQRFAETVSSEKFFEAFFRPFS